jgi:hypothetical protein
VRTDEPHRVARAAELMLAFAERTGLEPAGEQRRYLWTDAFAVGNFLNLARALGEDRYRELALRLVDDVHQVLGRHRPDDGRAGWLSGRDESDGAAHPTGAGLRIGKKLPERPADQPFDDELEWERDGQYFHYLTRWMHALSAAARATGSAAFVTWARELGRAAHDGFVTESPAGKRMYWKMSIDLSRPQVRSMGQHDPFDGYVACLEVEAAAARVPGAGGPALGELAADFASMIDPQGLATGDPLGIGALLMAACHLEQLAAEGVALDESLLDAALAAAVAGLDTFARRGGVGGAAGHRLAFREAGLAIGLEAAALIAAAERGAGGGLRRRALLQALVGHRSLADDILSFWLEGPGAARRSGEQQDIDEVMLATALLPARFD